MDTKDNKLYKLKKNLIIILKKTNKQKLIIIFKKTN
jgi:hypothetical protein